MTDDEEVKGKDMFANDMDMKFPVITISLSYDDPVEPIHVDLGSVPPFIATAILEKILDVMQDLEVGPKVTFKGVTLLDAEPFYGDLDFDFSDDDEVDDDD
jgi:hypothetical protein